MKRLRSNHGAICSDSEVLEGALAPQGSPLQRVVLYGAGGIPWPAWRQPACPLAEVACPKACQAGVPGRAGDYRPGAWGGYELRQRVIEGRGDHSRMIDAPGKS